VVAGRCGAAPSSLGIDAYEHEPTCTQSSGPTECAGMIRCDTRIWGDAAQSVIGQSGRHGWGGNTGASAMPYRSDACFFILFQVPFFGSTRAAEHSSVPTAKSCSRRAQGASRPAGTLPVRHLRRFQAAP
jgi:hypothetical protein